MSSEAMYRCETINSEIVVVSLMPALNDALWTDIDTIGKAIVEQAVRHHKPKAVVDLTELRHMGSSMVALVVRIWKAVNEKEGQFVIINNTDLVHEVLTIAGLSKYWTIVGSRAEAYETLGHRLTENGEPSTASRGSVVAIALSAFLLLLGIALILDCFADGQLRSQFGKSTVAFVAVGISMCAATVALLTRRSAGPKFAAMSVVIATLSCVLVLVAILVATNRINISIDPHVSTQVPASHLGLTVK